MFDFVLARRFRNRIRNPFQLFSSTNNKWTTTSLTHLQFLHNLSVSKALVEEEPTKKQNISSSSLTVLYLVNKCGLSPQSALSASKKIQLKTTEKPDSIINVFKSYDFTDTQIAKLINRSPRLLSFNPDKIIIPKLEFFLGVGFSSSQLIEIICLYPDLLENSLEKRLKPNFRLLTSIFETDQQIALALRRTSRLLRANLETNVLPNVRTLHGYGVPAPNIAKLATLYPRALTRATEKFKVTVESIVNMGFDPSKTLFLRGIGAMSGLTPSSWERKVAVYKSVGWSEAEIISAFSKHPFCMLNSEEKIRQAADIFAKKMHWKPSYVAENPTLLNLSLEKRVIPRCSVLGVLVSKGMVKNLSTTFLKKSEKDFFNNYVIKYQDLVPEVLQAYNGNLDLVGT